MSPYISSRPDFDAAARRIMEAKKRTEETKKGKNRTMTMMTRTRKKFTSSPVSCVLMMDDFAVGLNMIR